MEPKVILFGVDGLIPELVDRFIAENALPNIQYMLENGAGTKMLPFISTWGDVNFTSLLSGQSPGISWKGQGLPQQEDHLLELLAKQQKRCALVHFPASVSVSDEGNHFVFAPFRSGLASFELAPAVLYTTTPGERQTDENHKDQLGWPPEGTLAHHEKNNQQSVMVNGDGYHILIKAHDGSQIEVQMAPVSEKQIRLSFPDNQQQILTLGHWDEWLTIPIGERQGKVRFRLCEYDPVLGKLVVIQSQITVQEGFSNDLLLEQKLLQQCGPFISKWAVTISPDERYADSSYEEGEYQAEWLVSAALFLLEQGLDFFSTVYRLNDETHHTCLGECDPASPFYTAERASVCEETIRKSYKILDQAIGRLLSEKSDDTQLILVSDHGDVPNTYVCDVYRRLEESGLVTLDDLGRIDPKRSKAYMKNERGGLEIYVNLKGRENDGIVDPQDFNTIQTEIFKALTTWYVETPKGIQNVSALTLKKGDAVMIGYWGEEAGDVIFAYNQGFVWGRNGAATSCAPVSSPGANHGPQIPSAKTEYASNYGIAIMQGACIQKGYFRNDLRLGPYLMNDMGVTIANLLGVYNSGSMDGRIMNDMLK